MEKIKHIILSVIFFLFPLFFLPVTQEFFITQKLYLLSFGVLLLIVVSGIELISTRRMKWRWSGFDTGVAVFLITVVLSIVFASPNKIQALLDPYLGFASIFTLSLLYFFATRSHSKKQAELYLRIMQYSSMVVALLAIFFFFNPFKNVVFPPELSFLRFSAFSTIGNQLDLVIFLGFFFIISFVQLLLQKHKNTGEAIALLSIQTLALVLSVFHLLKPENAQLAVILPPYRLSWYSAVEILKYPSRFIKLSPGPTASYDAMFGAGVNNFSSVFTHVKDSLYNQSSLWQINSFNAGRSAILQIFTELGVLGFAAFAFLSVTATRAVQSISKENHLRGLLVAAGLYVAIVLLFFPISLISMFLFFFLLILVSQELTHDSEEKVEEWTLPAPAAATLGIVFIILACTAGYFLQKSYHAELAYKASLNGILHNNLKDLYDNERLAIQLNPNVERFHTSFAQTNLFVANSIINARRQQQKDTNAQIKLTNADKQQISQAVQTAISEGRTAVILNSTKAENWQVWAEVYRSILGVVKDSDAWSTSTYQRAILLDPANPAYRLNLGGIFYSLKDYPDAGTLFAQSIQLKPDWPNAHYNLAWDYYQLKDYKNAASEMQNVLKLLNPQTNAADYKKAKAEFEQFKAKIPADTTASTSEAQSALQLPPKQPEISPKLELNTKDASPAAK